jgi:hypothetical protein
MSYTFSVIPGGHKKFTTAADHDFNSEKPNKSLFQCVGVRINDTTSGTSLELLIGSQSVVYNNLVEGEVITGMFSGLVASGSTCDSVITFYR